MYINRFSFNIEIYEPEEYKETGYYVRRQVVYTLLLNVINILS